ncbi:MAG: hypothetical protein LC808_05800, partial [Actinobacteria bacterium]|nr:hypothetical protein [Actinomycetota bacterium]
MRWPATPDGRPHTPLDPGHSHETVMLQLGLTGHHVEPNSGFVASYRDKAGPAMIIQARKAGIDLGAVVMGCLNETSSPAINRLAKEFGICRRWFSSVPGETWPNRNFAHAATSDNTVNIELGVYTDPTIFELLEKASGGLGGRRAWRVYHDGPAQVMAFRKLLGRGPHRQLRRSRRLPQACRGRHVSPVQLHRAEPQHARRAPVPSAQQQPLEPPRRGLHFGDCERISRSGPSEVEREAGQGPVHRRSRLYPERSIRQRTRRRMGDGHDAAAGQRP